MAASARDAAIHKKILHTTLTISNEEMNDIMKIIKYFDQSGLLIEGVSETNKKETKVQTGRFLGILLSTLSASLLGNLVAGKDRIIADEGTIRAGQRF